MSYPTDSKDSMPDFLSSVNYLYRKNLSPKSIKFLEYCYTHRELDRKPFTILSPTSIVRILPFLLTEKTRIELELSIIVTEDHDQLREIREVCEFAGLDTRYIEKAYTNYLKSHLKG